VATTLCFTQNSSESHPVAVSFFDFKTMTLTLQ
jgi:hypothetical protein